jgi:hypothetical protein
MDDADRAQLQEERQHAARIAARAPAGPAPAGHCLYCGTPLPPGRRWCDADCRDDWAAEHERPGRHQPPAG